MIMPDNVLGATMESCAADPTTPAEDIDALRAETSRLRDLLASISEALDGGEAPLEAIPRLVAFLGQQMATEVHAAREARAALAEAKREAEQARAHIARLERYHAGPALDATTAAMERLATDATDAERERDNLIRERREFCAALGLPPETGASEVLSEIGRLMALRRDYHERVADGEEDARLPRILALAALAENIRHGAVFGNCGDPATALRSPPTGDTPHERLVRSMVGATLAAAELYADDLDRPIDAQEDDDGAAVRLDGLVARLVDAVAELEERRVGGGA